MDTARAAQLQALLEGVSLPAEKADLLAYAVRQHAEPDLLEALRELPDRRYVSLDEVGEELLHVQPPPRRREEHPAPRDESGAPPGGAEYTNPDPEPGRVRDVDQVDGG